MEKRNATGSWSGYIHQGRVGLLVALRELHSLLKDGDESEIALYKLIYENAEDFDIQKGEKVMSRHQVKCYKDGTTPNAYKNVLGIQKRKFVNNSWTLENEGFQIHDYKSDGEIIENVVDKNHRYLHTIKEVRGFELSEEEFADWKKNNLDVSNNIQYVANPNNVQLYEYEPGMKYCKLQIDDTNNELRKYCVAKIEAIIKLKNPRLNDEPDILTQRYNQLLDIIDGKIHIAHASQNYVAFPELSFSELLETILNDKEIELGTLRVFRRLVSKYWDEYCSDLIYEELFELPFSVDNTDLERVQELLDAICCFDDNEFKKFIFQIQPTRKQDDENLGIQDLNSICTKNQMKRIFFHVLLGVKKVPFLTKNATFDKDGGYALSLINYEKTEILVAARDIIESRSLLKNIYEKSFLINQSIDGEPVLNYFNHDKVLHATNNWGENADIIEKMDFTKSNLSFISVPMSIKKLNGETDD